MIAVYRSPHPLLQGRVRKTYFIQKTTGTILWLILCQRIVPVACYQSESQSEPLSQSQSLPLSQLSQSSSSSQDEESEE